MDLVSPLGRAIRTICNPIIKVDGTVMPRAAFLNTLLARLCHALVEGFAVVWDVFSSTSDPIFPDFPKRFLLFLKTRDCKNRFRIGDCQCSVLYFCLVWKTRLYLYCRCKIPCFVHFFLDCLNNCFDENFVCWIFIFLTKKQYIHRIMPPRIIQ